MSVTPLFGETPSSARLKSYLEEVASSLGAIVPEPEVKSYPDAVYFNYYILGLSLLFAPGAAYKPSPNAPLEHEKLFLESIDVFNPVKNAASSKGRAYRQFPLLPLVVSASAHPASAQVEFELKPETTGKDLVQGLGEPTRKGGGAGPASGSIDIWCEWAQHGIMVEFGGEEARGPQAWERGKDAVWKVVTLFKAKDV